MARLIGYREHGVDVSFVDYKGALLTRRGTNLLMTSWTVTEGVVRHVGSLALPVMVSPVSLPSKPEHVPTNLPTARVVRWNGKR